MRKIVPILIAVVGLAAGSGAGLALRPPADSPAEGEGHPAPAQGHEKADDEAAGLPEFVKLNNQFVVPVVEDGHVASLVILSLSLQVAEGQTDAVYAREPKLRDAFLQVMFDHANSGGFRGSFTETTTMRTLRRALLETAQTIFGKDGVSDVLIVDIVRQDG